MPTKRKPLISIKRHGLRLAALIAVAAILGCGSDIRPSGLVQVAIVPSPLIQTGAWTIEGDSASGGQFNVYPITGFFGALTVNGDAVQAGLTIASSDTPGSDIPSRCLGNTMGLNATGTIANGLLTLDSDFPNNHLHLVGQISTDSKSLTSGSYTVTGSCATTAPNLGGYWNAPLTGTYTGQLNSQSGVNVQVTATLSQESYYWDYGYIPVDGNILFTTAGCTTIMQLNSGYVVGSLSLLGGYTSSTMYFGIGPSNNALVAGQEDPPSQTISNINWGYPDSGCGAQDGDPNNSGTLTRQ